MPHQILVTRDIRTLSPILPVFSPRRNVKQYPEAREVEGMLLLRVDAPLYFANVNPVKDALYKYERRAKEIAAAQGRSLHFIIIDLSPVNDIDASAVHFFKVGSPFPFFIQHSCA